MTLAQVPAAIAEIWAYIKGVPAFADQLANAKAEAATLKEKLSASEAETAKLQASLAAKDSEITAAKADATKAQEASAAAETAKATAEKALADLQDSPSKQAVEIAAKAGVKPEDRPKGAGATGANAVTAAEFRAMSHEQRNAHIRAGGKIAN